MATTKAASSGSKSKPGAKSATPKTTAANAASKTKSAAKKPTPRKAAGGESVKRFDGRTTKQPPAFALLMRQHREVEGWFEQFEKADSDDAKGELAQKICKALKAHTQIEEEFLYPPAHEKLDDEDMVDEAYVEHDSAKMLIAQIEAMRPGEHMYDAKVKVLSEYIKHHVREEESELFPEIENADIDLEAIGARMEARWDELMNEPDEPSARRRFIDRLRNSFEPRT